VLIPAKVVLRMWSDNSDLNLSATKAVVDFSTKIKMQV
jgi:hypothetical protein